MSSTSSLGFSAPEEAVNSWLAHRGETSPGPFCLQGGAAEDLPGCLLSGGPQASGTVYTVSKVVRVEWLHGKEEPGAGSARGHMPTVRAGEAD